MGKDYYVMIYDKKQGSLLNYIQMPLNVVTPGGTYIGLNYDGGIPKYILSHVKVITYDIKDLVFSSFSKNAIIDNNEPLLEITDNKIGYQYNVTDIEEKYGYITVASTRIDIADGRISKNAAMFLLEKQLRSISNVLENFINVQLSQTQYDALLYYFYNIGVDKIETSAIIELINMKRWYDITDEFQDNIKRNSGKVDEHLAAIKIRTAKMWSYVPGF